MSSIRSKLVRFFIVEHSMRKLFDPYLTTIEQMRASAIKVNKRISLPRNSVVEPISIKGVNAEWLRAENVPSDTTRILLYFHSGAFCLGYNNPHRDFALRISKGANVRVLAIDYRLAPEHKYPAANEDCINVYRGLLESGVKPENIVFGGDSAGAGLVLMTLLSLKQAKEPLPKAAFLLSLCGGDLKDFDGESYKTREGRDPLNSKRAMKKFAELYLGGQVIEPAIDADLSGLPPLLIQVGDDEIVLSDSIRLAERAKKAGVNVTLEIWEDMWHVFQGFSMMVPEAKQALGNISQFINDSFRSA